MSAVDADVLGVEQVRRAERLVALRKQRMLLEGLHEDIGISIGLLSSVPRGSRWRSPAETLYASRRDQLRRDLWAALRQVDEAVDAVTRAITTAGE